MGLLLGLSIGCATACSSSTAPPETESAPGGFGGSTPYVPPCNASATVDSGSGVFNFEAGFDAGLGIGTTNPTTPSDGGSVFGDGSTGTVDSGTPCNR